jgi:hypothetical protein
MVGYEIARDSEATIEKPQANLSISYSSVRSRNSGLKTDPLSYTLLITSPWANSQLGKQSRLRRAHLVTLIDQLHRGDNFHSTLVNLGGNVKNLKEDSHKLELPMNSEYKGRLK